MIHPLQRRTGLAAGRLPGGGRRTYCRTSRRGKRLQERGCTDQDPPGAQLLARLPHHVADMVLMAGRRGCRRVAALRRRRHIHAAVSVFSYELPRLISIFFLLSRSPSACMNPAIALSRQPFSAEQTTTEYTDHACPLHHHGLGSIKISSLKHQAGEFGGSVKPTRPAAVKG